MLDYCRDRLKTRDAFSTAEMLLVLLIISFLVLAMPPLIHKKFEKNLRRAEHGRYECWRDATTGNVYEFVATEKQGPQEDDMIGIETVPDPKNPGSTIEKKVPKGVSRGEDGRCRFDAQKYAPNAAFFSMQAIGGGAGGSYPIWDGTGKYIKDGEKDEREVKLTNIDYNLAKETGCAYCDPDHMSYYAYLSYYNGQEATQWVPQFFTPVLSIAPFNMCAAQGNPGRPYISIAEKRAPEYDEWGNLTGYTEEIIGYQLHINYGGVGGRGYCYTANTGSLALGGWYAPKRSYPISSSFPSEVNLWTDDHDYNPTPKENVIVAKTHYVGGGGCYYYPFGGNGFAIPDDTVCNANEISNKTGLKATSEGHPALRQQSTYDIIRSSKDNPVWDIDNVEARYKCTAAGWAAGCQTFMRLDPNQRHSGTEVIDLPNDGNIKYGFRCSNVATSLVGSLYSEQFSGSFESGDILNAATCATAEETAAYIDPDTGLIVPAKPLPNYYVRAQYYDKDEPNGLAWTYCKVYPGFNGENYDNSVLDYNSDPSMGAITMPAAKDPILLNSPATPAFGDMTNIHSKSPAIRPPADSSKMPLCESTIWGSGITNATSSMSRTGLRTVFPDSIMMTQEYSFNTPTYGFAGTPGELATQMLPKFDGNLEITLGNAGAAGTKGSRSGENGTDTVVWLKSRSLADNVVCDENNPQCKYVLTGKGGISIPGGNMGPKIKLKGSHTCKIIKDDGSVDYNTKIHGCLDSGVATINEAKQRYAVDSGFRTIPEFDKKTKTPSALSVMYDGDREFNPGSGGDGGYSFVTSFGDRMPKVYRNNSNPIRVEALQAIYGEAYIAEEGIVDDGSGISYGGQPVDLSGEISDYRCYTRFDGNDDAVGSGNEDQTDQEAYVGTDKVKICKPKGGTPGAVVIVW